MSAHKSAEPPRTTPVIRLRHPPPAIRLISPWISPDLHCFDSCGLQWAPEAFTLVPAGSLYNQSSDRGKETEK